MSISTPVYESEWKSSWTLVLAASIGFSFYSVMVGSTGLFMQPLGREFGWSRTLLSSGTSIAVVMTAVLSPVFGVLIDRLGCRRLVLPGLLLTILSIASFSLVNGSQVQWVLLWAAFGLVSTSIKSTAWTAAVLGVFSRSRGLALALTLSGTAVAQIIVPPLANWLIGGFGWRGAYLGLALGWGGITLLFVYLFLYDARDRAAGRRPNVRRAPPPEAAADLPGLTARAALRDPALWRVAISNFMVMTLTMGLTIHLFPILTDAGISRVNAAWLTSLAGIAGIIGKLVTGVLLDRFRPNWIGGLTLGAASLAFLLLIDGVRSPAMVVCAMVVNGYAAGTKTQITGFLTAGYGGMRHFGAIYSVMGSLMALASGMGPLLAGWIFDRSGGYGPFLIAGTIGCALGGLLMISLPAYPAWTRRADA